MNTKRQDLAHALKIRFGTAPHEPTHSQLDLIVGDINEVKKTRVPTDQDWRDSVHRQCPSAGTHKYAGMDNSDLNALLAEATAQASGQR